MWESRKGEHRDKVRLTLQNIKNENIECAQTRMNAGDGGLAKHAATCPAGIKWGGAKVVERERK